MERNKGLGVIKTQSVQHFHITVKRCFINYSYLRHIEVASEARVTMIAYHQRRPIAMAKYMKLNRKDTYKIYKKKEKNIYHTYLFVIFLNVYVNT